MLIKNEIFTNIKEEYENKKTVYIPIDKLLLKWSISKTKEDEELFNEYVKKTNKIIGLLVYKKDNYSFWIENSYESEDENDDENE
jgi:hypothetical protein